jgi:hypothetical protein
MFTVSESGCSRNPENRVASERKMNAEGIGAMSGVTRCVTGLFQSAQATENQLCA